MDKNIITGKKEFSMKKTLKNYLAVLTAIVTLTASFAFTAIAAGPVSGQCGNDVYWSYDPDNKVLTVSGSGAMWDFRDDADYFDYHDCSYAMMKWRLKAVRFCEGVTYIGANAFAECRNLSEIEWADSIKTIGSFAFYMTGLREVTVPDTVESIGQQAFSQCENLTKAKLSDNADFLSAGLFDFDKNLTEVDLGGCHPCVYAFGTIGRCPSLKRITVDKDNPLFSVRDGVLFCRNVIWQFPAAADVSSYVIPDGTDTISTFTFSNSQNLRSVFIPSSVTYMYDIAFGESSVTDLYYEGSEEQWNALGITKSNNHIIFGYVNVHFNATPGQMEEESETHPAEEHTTEESTTVEATTAEPTTDEFTTVEATTAEPSTDEFTTEAYTDPEEATGITESGTDPNGEGYTGSGEELDITGVSHHANGIVSVKGNTVYVTCGITVGEVYEHFGDAHIRLYGGDGCQMTDTDLMKKGYTAVSGDGSTYDVVIVGDPDGDGKVTPSDARYALRLSVGLETDTADSYSYRAADADMTNGISSDDARSILRLSLGLDRY